MRKGAIVRLVSGPPADPLMNSLEKLFARDFTRTQGHQVLGVHLTVDKLDINGRQAFYEGNKGHF